eukprot:CAMPEP_0194109988 /NCGR_PEP_ID=MMETSP0150-20130528/9346_1 /TAXON_ID=122233 /ORGANISM="Chaetoceros debilis, Strain MM31A-1" /LENGTH=506 /DNA_ID=CAMNT_0038799053 /DNA_START=232 /DNA_END=1752 /DNA_ORIENTATION=-
MEWLQDLYTTCTDGEGNIITENGNKILVNIERIKQERGKNKWVTFDRHGDYIVQVPYAQSSILVPISFCDSNDIKHVLSYRWAGAYGQSLVGSDAPIDFLRISATEKVWVDYLNHLNNDELKADVINNMGSLYNSRPVHAKYLHDFSPSTDCKGLAKLLACITRGWIWQEIAFTGPDVTPKKAQAVTLLVELIKSGSEVVRCLIDDGFFTPKDKNVDEVIKFAIDVLWRARNLADNQSAYVFFIEDGELNENIINRAVEKVISLRMDNPNDPSKNITMKVLAALDNLENANYTMVEDGFLASFSTLLQSNTEIFGPIPPGKVAPDNLHVTVTDMLRTFTKEQGWNVEFWQQNVIDHPLSQLHHPKFESIVISSGQISVVVEGGHSFGLKLCYNILLQGQELEKSTTSIDGKHDILSLSYRINCGELYVIAFQTKTKMRVVPSGALHVTESSVEEVKESNMSSKWAQTTWYARDTDWLNVLEKWKKADVVSKKRTIFGKRSNGVAVN